MNLTINGICISINVTHPELQREAYKFFKNFITEDKPQIIMNVNYSDFPKPVHNKVIVRAKGREIGLENGKRYFLYKNNSAIAWFYPGFKTVDIYIKDSEGVVMLDRAVSLLLLGLLHRKKGLLLHACGIKINNHGFLFMGSAGSGKTTIANLATDEDAEVINDDMIIVQKNGKKIEMSNEFFGVWKRGIEKEPIRRATISAIFFLHKGKKNLAIPINGSFAILKLMKSSNLSFLYSRETVDLLNLYKYMVEKVPCYNLSFVKNKSVWKYIQNRRLN